MPGYPAFDVERDASRIEEMFAGNRMRGKRNYGTALESLELRIGEGGGVRRVDRVGIDDARLA